MKEINFSKVEKKWQNAWEKKKAFVVNEKSKKKKYYVLEMFPYPSSSGLHMGHALNYTIGDIYSRFKRMQGFNVLYPMGFDSLGLPAENAARKAKSHPKKFTEKAIENYIKQMKELGLSYDWTRKIETHKPEYYKWDQWIFLKMLEKRLAYKKKSSVNWCPKCNSVLANEQVHNGKCWRHEDCDVEVKQLDQWFFRITKYADELYNGIDKLKDWPELIKKLQRNWIGRSEGTEIGFKIGKEIWPVFTTRADTLFGVTFMVISAQHPKLMDLVTESEKGKVEKFLKKIRSTKEEDLDKLEKEGVFTGAYAEHPLTGEKIPVWTGNFVLAEYGSGMVMAVPAHDSRDFQFAKKYGIKIKTVIQSIDKDESYDVESMKDAFVSFGKLENSEGFDGLKSQEAIEHISNAVEMKKLGKKTVNFRLRDWLISRQRFWGTPIPIIYCNKCGIVPVPEKDLPVLLPEKAKFGKGNALEKDEKFLKTKCPECGEMARRETDTMDTFVNSSWYYLRYTDPENKKKIFDSKKAKYWAPVDLYIGGKEHATMHLIYIRFYTKFLRDLGIIGFDEPTNKLFNQGILAGPDGEKMSKSKGNVVLPESVSKKYGMDSARLFLISSAGPDKDINWSDKGVEGSLRFVKKVFDFSRNAKIGKSSKRIESKINKGIKEISEDIENMGYNFAVIKLRDVFDVLEREEEIGKKDLESFVKMFSVFCPHVGEELWEKIGGKGFVSLSDWPKVDEKKIDERFEKADEALEKTVSDVLNVLNIVKEKTGKEAEKVYVYVIPNELENYNSEELERRVGVKTEVFAVNDKAKIDPEGKSKKAKPGKPGIFIE